MVDWNDHTKRKVFREALQKAYPNNDALAIFVDEELNENLASIAGGDNLQAITYNLVKWALANGRMQGQGIRPERYLYNAFKQANPRHPVIEKLEQSSIVSQTYKLTEGDWDVLFEQFLPDDLADLQRAFRRGFKQAVGIEFYQAQPNPPSFVELNQIREVLGRYATGDRGPVLAVRFVDCAISEIHRSNEGNDRDLTALEQWRDSIAQRFNVSALTPKPSNRTARHAYLLIALEEIGSDVNVYPELRIGTDLPIRFGAQPTTCSLNQVAGWVSEWICLAEEVVLDDESCDAEVTLEIFLPCQHLEADIATTWMIKARRGGEQSLGTYRRFVVRSSDRIRDRQIQKLLERKWPKLQTSVQAQNVVSQIHRQENCPKEKGVLSAVLKDLEATVLTLVAQLPADPGKRRDLLNDIIDAALPIALWPADTADAHTLDAEFNHLLHHKHLIDFADLAKQWRLRRMQYESAKHIRLLCDRPDRLPRLPDLSHREDEDAIVA